MRRILIGVGVGLAGALIALAVSRTDFGRRAEAITYDWRLAQEPSPARDDIVIVDINESSVKALAPIVGRWPWPRLIHSGVIDYLARARARFVVYDVQFTERATQDTYRIGDRTITGPESDSQLASSVRRAGTVILLADALFEGLANDSDSLEKCGKPVPSGTIYSPGAGLFVRPSVCPPFAELQDGAAALGHDFLQKDRDGVSRRMFPFIESQGVAVPSLGTAAVLLANQVAAESVKLEGRTLRIGDAAVPLDEHGAMLLKLRGPYAKGDRSTYPIYPFFDVLLSEQNVIDGKEPPIPESAFENKIVFVGAGATGLTDVHATAFGGTTPGVYLHATLADNILSRQFMRQSSEATNVALVVFTGLAGGLAAAALPVWWALAAVTVLGAGGIVWLTRAVGAGVWAPLVAPMLAAGVAFVGGLAWQYFVEGREKRHVKQLFGRYVSPAIFHQLIADPQIARLGGGRREMTVLFSDIRNFTTASEKGTPEEVVSQLNEYFGAMVEVLFRHNGTLDKFVGDMVMGLFGAPVDDPHHADNAVAAAVEMSAVLSRLNTRWAAAGQPVLDIGIGINSGVMIAGNIGSQSIMSYTVIGDAVNLGSRIESLNKEYGTRILISQATRDQLKRPFATRRVGEAHVKGRHEPVVVWEVLGADTGGVS
ncbi:MAG TPA: adenylate/guanylate cyclase domain-containing protein [Vicinamibacterales bacterium]|nr:adenylate/guanylate cyclase domain-containing protein [Vicinamibacterales bacterium]